MRTAVTTASVALAALVATACVPPEAERVRGGDRGGDIGNRSPIIEMHAGSEIYHDYRCGVRGAECTGPMPVSGLVPADTPLVISGFVLEHMGMGGRVRPVIYLPPPDLALPEPEEIELPFPGPGIEGEDPEPDEEPT
jgi:hypothetical protein